MSAQKQILDPVLQAMIVDQAPDAIVVMDLALKVRMANPKACELFGYTREELLRLSLTDLDAQMEAGKIRQTMDRLMREKETLFESHAIRKDSSVIPVEIKACLVDSAGETYLIAFGRDISERKKVEKTLHEEKALLDALFENIPDCIFFKDRDCRLIRINRKFMLELGFTHESQAVGKNDTELFGEEFGLKTLAIDRHIIASGEPSIGEVESRKLPDGSINWTLTTKVPLFDDAGRVIGIAGVAREINEIKRSEEKLRIKENQLSIAGQIAGLGYWEYSVEENLYTFNDHFYRIFHTTVAEVGTYRMTPQEYVARFLPPEEQGIVEKEIKRTLGSAEPDFKGQVEHRIRYPDGSTGYIAVRFFVTRNDYGQIIRIFGANQNITERKLAEKAIADSEARLSVATQMAGLGYWEFNSADRMLTLTDQFYHIYKTSAQEMGGYRMSLERYAELFLLPEDKEVLDDESERARKSSGNQYQRYTEQRVRFANGEIGYMAVRFVQVKDDRYPHGKTIGVTQDITERKLAENELTKYREHLEQLVQQRTAQLEDINQDLEAFAYSISHDLRAPLRHINGFSNLLRKKIDPYNREADEYIKLIHETSIRMGNMIDALLHFSRVGRQKIRWTVIDLNKLVEEVIHSFKPDIEKRKIDWQIGELPTVYGDFNLLKIAFANLISNAIKYTRGRKTARIMIGSQQEPGAKPSIFIKDNGVGFEMLYADKLFGVFQRLHKDEEFEGTGIGLANTWQIIRKHGGHIKAMGEVDKGATFLIIF